MNGLNGHSNGGMAHPGVEQDRSLGHGQNGLNGHAHTDNVHWSPPYPMVCLPDSSNTNGMTQTNGINKQDSFPPQIAFQITNTPRPDLPNNSANTTTVCTSVFAPITTATPRNPSLTMANPLANGIQAMQFSRPMATEFTQPIMKIMGPATFLPLRPSGMASLDSITHGWRNRCIEFVTEREVSRQFRSTHCDKHFGENVQRYPCIYSPIHSFNIYVFYQFAFMHENVPRRITKIKRSLFDTDRATKRQRYIHAHYEGWFNFILSLWNYLSKNVFILFPVIFIRCTYGKS